MKRLIAALLTVVVIAVPVSAGSSNAFTIDDALNILKDLAGLQELTAEQKNLYDINKSGDVTIEDALEILKFLAGLESLVTFETAVGDIVHFGEYQWRVLDVQDGRALIITRNVVERRAFSNRDVTGDITWATSDIRTYLNGEFYNSFSESDRARIVPTDNTTSNNQWFATSGGTSTLDNIFLLSLCEVVKYYGDSGQLQNRPSNNFATGDFIISDQYNTSRIAAHEAGFEGVGFGEGWWLRSPGQRSGYAAVVGIDGDIRVSGSFTDFSGLWIRPALWLEL
jgi:hypothetical protein